jgi:hypothetical protein
MITHRIAGVQELNRKTKDLRVSQETFCIPGHELLQGGFVTYYLMSLK